MLRLFPWIISYPNPFMTLLTIVVIINNMETKNRNIETIRMLKMLYLTNNLINKNGLLFWKLYINYLHSNCVYNN